MIDLHTHILPACDDGPAELATAVEMARAAAADGVRVMAATPHAFGTHLDVAPQERDERLATLIAETARLGIPVRIVPGFECRVIETLPEILAAQPEFLYPRSFGSVSPGEPVPAALDPAGGSATRDQDRLNSGVAARPHRRVRHVLIELTEDMPIACADAMLFRLRMLRITPVLAHPERHPAVQREVSVLEGFVHRGGILQVTASGLLGAGGRRERRTCEKLLRAGLAGILATDAHSPEEAGSLGKALARARKLIGSAAEALVTATPAGILGLEG